jgi:hypothetical protein
MFSEVDRSSGRAFALPAGQAFAVSRTVGDDDIQALTDDDIALLRKDIRSRKKQVVAANMDLTDAQAEKFWPLYDQYTADLSKINDAKTALVKDYFEHHATLNDEQAEHYIRQRAEIEQSISRLKVEYVPRFRKVLSGKQAALFFQIDWRISLLIDLQLARMPLIEP